MITSIPVFADIKNKLCVVNFDSQDVFQSGKPVSIADAVSIIRDNQSVAWLSYKFHDVRKRRRFLQKCQADGLLKKFMFGYLPDLARPMLLKKYAGGTKSVVDVLLLDDDVGVGEVAATGPHPASVAVEYLVKNGCNRVKLWRYVSWLGDVPFVFADTLCWAKGTITDQALRGDDQFENLIMEAVNKHPLLGHSFCRAINPDILKNVCAWFSGEDSQDPRVTLTLSRRWLKGDRPEEPGSDFLYTAIRMNESMAIGMCVAITLITRLLVSSWLSSQYHTDLFDDGPFHFAANASAHKKEFYYGSHSSE